MAQAPVNVGGMSAKGLIRRARDHKGWTMGQLAIAAGVGQSSVWDVETRDRPSVDNLEKYGRAMGLELYLYFIDPATDKIIR